MSQLWPIAAITFREGTRNRAFYGISLVALLLMGAAFLMAGMIPRDVGKVAVDLVLSTISFTGLLLVLFVGIDLMAKDLDKRTIYMVLARPISRQQYILGKFLGIALLIVTTVFMLSIFGAITLVLTKLANPGYFPRFSLVHVLLAEVFIALSLILVAALSLLFASFSSTSFITLVLTIISYIIGQSLSSVKEIVEAPEAAGITVAPLTVKLVQTAYYVFPNLTFFDIKTQAAHGLALHAPYILWTLSYGIVYTGIAILLASLIFAKKEFP
jgi:ABC-type transport system involved in multi-copper enzyme maturation permease subunit